MKRAYWKDIGRTLKYGKKRFFSILVIVALGVTVLTGLTASCEDLRYSADALYDEQNLFDISISSTLGLDEEDIEALEDIEGVASVEGEYSQTIYTEIGGISEEAEIRTMGSEINVPTVVEGRLPEAEDEIAVTQTYLLDTGKEVGDTLTFTYEAGGADSDGDEEGEDAGNREDGTEKDKGGEDDTDAENSTDGSGDSSEDEVFEERVYTITAEVLNPFDVNNRDGSVSFRSTTSVDYTFFVPWVAADTDIYTAVYLSLDGAEELFCYGDEYTELVNEVEDRIEEEVLEERQDARTETVKSDALESYEEAEEEAEEEFADAEEELEEAREELDDGWEELKEGREELEDGRQQMEDGWEELEEGIAELESQEALAEEEFAAAEDEIEDGYAQVEESQAELAAAEGEIAASEAELAESESEIAAAEEEIDASEEELNSALEELEAAEEELAGAISELEAQKEELEAALEQLTGSAPLQTEDAEQSESGTDESGAGAADAENALQGQIEEIETALAQIEEALSEAEDGLAEIENNKAEAETGLAQLSAAREELEAGREELESGKEQISEARAELEAGETALSGALVELEDGEAELDEQRALADEEFASAWETIEESEETLAGSEEELAEGEDELDEGEKELEDAEEELAEGEEEYEEGKAEAEEELADAYEEILKIDTAKWYVQGRTSLGGYSNVDSDASSIEGIATFFPLIFLVVAVLITLTTMTRMVEEDRSLIGTYKALGFTNREIRRKYVLYGLAASIAGCIAGDFCGFIILPKVIFSFFKMMYMIPEYVLRFELASALAGFVIFTAGVLIAVFSACRAVLSDMPAVLMRPQAPKGGSRIFLERAHRFWGRLSFLNKVTARNLFRYKKRLLMTVFGIAGCTALLVCGFAIKNSVTELMPLQYEVVNHYDILAASSSDDNEDLVSYMDDENIESWMNLQAETVDITNAEGEELSVQMFVIPEGAELETFISLTSDDGEAVSPGESGILLTKSASDVMDLDAGDTLMIQDLSLNEAEAEVDAVVENYLGNYVYISQELYEELFGSYAPNAVLVNLTDSCGDAIAYADEIGAKDGVVSTTCTEEMENDFAKAFTLMNMVVYVILILAAALAFVVLFTLSTTNISEREREIATLKVLGFFDREVHLYINKETMILSAAGILIGLPAGYFVSGCLTWALKIPGLYFAITIYPQSYLFAALIAFGFTIIVDQITNRILNKVDMVEALKSIE